MQMTRTRRGPSDRTLNRLIVGMALALVVGVPLVGVLYFMDRYVDPGPTMLERSITQGEEAVRQNPNQVGTRMQLALIYAGAERYADAIAQYGEVIKAQPDSVSALLGRGRAYAQSGQLDAAAADFQTVVDETRDGEMATADPQLEAAYYNLGAIALQQARPKDAVTLLGKAIAIDRTDADALNGLGTALIQTGDPKGAVEMLRRAIALVPTGWCDPYAALGQAYTALGDAAGAAYATGMVAFCEKRPEEAKQALAPVTSGPLAVDALVGLGLIAESEADTTAATDYYTRALAVDPQDFGAVTGMKRLGTATDAAPPSGAIPTPTTAPAPSAAGSDLP